MILAFIIGFIGAMLFNLMIIIFGKKNIAELQNKVSISKYLKEFNELCIEEMGDTAVTVCKLVMILFCIFLAVMNIFPMIAFVVAVTLGTGLSKKLYTIPSINALINLASVYINRLK